jgi:hydrogenase small subunit
VLKEYAEHAKAIICRGSCASWGCVQAAKPNPTRATPVHKIITNKPIIKVPGCPPIAEAGQFAEKFDDAGARQGFCLYKVDCKGPTTYNACSARRWNEGLSFPIQGGHGCIGCSEDDFWDKGGFYNHLTTVGIPGIAGAEGTADRIGATAAVATGVGIAAHAALSAIKQSRSKTRCRRSSTCRSRRCSPRSAAPRRAAWRRAGRRTR